ncbi:hypothetical protein [Luethyella okanaganae]|uniref:PBP domain-containing protein n=1 Tax=Luethyella okanaganae TaxID=69372 RepID=A0ABW1VGK2_9MICO
MSRIGSLLAVRLLSLAIAASSAVGLVLVNPSIAPAAQAATASDSEVSIKWTDATVGDVAQPRRDPQSPHYGDFTHLEVVVSQTKGLIDQGIDVRVSGMSQTQPGSDGLRAIPLAMNFVQAMQCWGDPADEATFRETCQWGGWAMERFGSQIEKVLPQDSWFRTQVQPGDVDVPFRDANAAADVPPVTGNSIVSPKNPALREWPLVSLFSASTSNEVPGVGINADGTTHFPFEVQSALQAPQLGCGSGVRSTASQRCYLVIVPRGSHFGGEVGEGKCAVGGYVADEYGSRIPNPDGSDRQYRPGEANAVQEGSPLNPKCDYWNNRVVVPLDFEPVTGTCPLGAKERGMVGSQLLVGAMGSWQRALCQSIGNVYNFVSNPDSTARSQLLAGRAGLAFMSDPLGTGILTARESENLATTDVVYAPIAISGGLVVSYAYENSAGRHEDLKFSPRLLAKLLTQSYPFQPPLYANSGEVIDHLGAVNLRYGYFINDPDVKALNPKITSSTNPKVILPGPSSADAIAQLWRWIQADKEAAAWLSGEPDPWGMTVNPYYLPKKSAQAKVPIVDDHGGIVKDASGKTTYRDVGLASIDDTPLNLATTPPSSFPKADETLAPKNMSSYPEIRTPYGSQQFSPYSENLLSTARDTIRANPHVKTEWDRYKFVSDGVIGDWVSIAPQPPGNKFIISVTDSASAERYGLNVAPLQLPNRPGVFVGPTPEGMTAALGTLVPVAGSPIKQPDVTRMPDTAYPLTLLSYAAVNLTTSDAAARKDYALMINQVTTTGQERGTARGKLPAGYLPLTDAMKAQAKNAAEAILNYVPKPKPGAAAAGPAAVAAPAGAPGAGAQQAAGGAPAGGQVTQNAAAVVSDQVTPKFDAPLPAQAALGVSLIVGLGGAAFAPLLMRPRRLGG